MRKQIALALVPLASLLLGGLAQVLAWGAFLGGVKPPPSNGTPLDGVHQTQAADRQ